MIDFIETFSNEQVEYFHILSEEIPKWLIEYADAPELKRLNGIGMLCGTNYSKIFHYKGFNSVYSHSIGVALIIWNFTHDKKQSLSGLFHDIATPTFKHCIDFMNGDSEKQESTEEKTEEIILNSKYLKGLLDRDNIKIEEVSDYHKYPIADNDTPRLSADRFEYTMSNGVFIYGKWNLEDIKKIYKNIIVVKNEDDLDELAFDNLNICEKFARESIPVFETYDSDNNRTVMQFFADILSLMSYKCYIKVDDLYKMSEDEVINLIKNCEDKNISSNFENFIKQEKIIASDLPFNDKYCISVKGKKRYIVPLVKNNNKVCRVNEVSDEIKKIISDYMIVKRSLYTGFDFEFKK